MSKIVICAENVSKQYRLGKIGTGSFSHDLNRWWHTVRGKDDPYLKIGEENDRTKSGTCEYVWALKDISFNVQQGDVIGIIGKNGAGKSTLLKILSRTTVPTTGNIKVKGRIASLLEVGTGFHPELTGRENVFLNGAILGMKAHEIRNKFDEIVDFSGVEKYIDTPVKRYSSGMYVRLAFAVAAHLEPEILIVDEVLAVGDAEFQLKALGKMKSVSQVDGRTVIFVSHNMTSIRNLCKKVILLRRGKISEDGPSDEILELYLKENEVPIYSKNSLGGIQVKEIKFINDNGNYTNFVNCFQNVFIEITVSSNDIFRNVSFSIGINDINNTRVFTLWTKFLDETIDLEKGEYKIVFEIENLKLTPGEYSIITYIDVKGIQLERIDNAANLVVAFRNNDNYRFAPKTSQGLYMEEFSFKVLKM